MRFAQGIAAWTAATVLGTAMALAQAVAPAPATAPAATGGPQASPAEIEFWNTVKDARNPAEFKAYLETYPNGAFAALAKVRIRALEEASSQKKATDDTKAAADAKATADAARAAAVAKAAADVRAQTASALTNPTTIREVQAKLYNLNYSVGPQTGALTNETREAIRQWQANVKKPVTGDMTASDVSLLRSASVPTTWGGHRLQCPRRIVRDLVARHAPGRRSGLPGRLPQAQWRQLQCRHGSQQRLRCRQFRERGGRQHAAQRRLRDRTADARPSDRSGAQRMPLAVKGPQQLRHPQHHVRRRQSQEVARRATPERLPA